MTVNQFDNIVKFATAIAEYEGFFKSGTRPRRNNNPGDLKIYDNSQMHDGNGFRIFPSEIEGWTALIHQILIDVNRGLTLRSFFAGNSNYPGYAPGQQAYNYIKYVAEKTGFNPDTPLVNYIGKD